MADHRKVPPQSQAGAKASAAGSPYSIDLVKFSSRLKALYSHWTHNKVDMWASADALAIATPPPSEDLRYLKSSALNIWLLGYEFPETVMVFMKKQIHFLCSQKKSSLLEVVKKPAKDAVGADVVMHVKMKNDDGGLLMDSIFAAIHAVRSGGDSGPVVGNIAREAPEGKLLETWTQKLGNESFQLGDITAGLSDLFAVKDNDELMCVRKAAYLSASVMKKVVVPKLENVIDEEKKVAHSALMDETEKSILEPAKAGVKLKAENVDICYPPIFQSGGVFDLRPSAASNDDLLYYDPASVIICAIGSRYNSYCSNVARSFLIDATSFQSKAYEVLLKAHEAAISALKPGNPVSAAYEAARSLVKSESPDLVAHLTKSAGTGIGLEFRESGLALNDRNDRLVKAGMVFNVSIGFQNLQIQSKNTKSQNFSLLLADTVVVGGDKTEVVTQASSKAVKDVAYSFNDDDEEEEVKPKPKVEAYRREPEMSKTALRSDNHEISKEEVRRQHQAELAQQKNEETARRLAGGEAGSGDSRGAAKSSTDLVAYKTVNDLPPPRELMILVDQKNEAVLLPIYGSMVPFHVATIRTVSSQQDTNRNCYIRIIFNFPGTPFSQQDANSAKYPGAIYLKEVSFRSKDTRHISEVVQLIKTLRRQVMARESERAERATLVSQEKLQLANNRSKPIRLSDLWIRPVFGGRGRKQPGTLEAHLNGFRYSTSRQDERVDIMFANIKHALFQPAQNEMITLLHFHLHNHIMVGNKKTKDVQFYVEVMDQVQNIGGGRRSTYDPDEIEEEQRERIKKSKINGEFDSFVSRVNELWTNPQFDGLDFDQPERQLGFHGVPYKSSAFIIPASTCLVELIETPFLVVTLAEVEIVNLERVGLGQKNFDMTIVFKDFKKDVMRIDSIPSTALEGIKHWLDAINIKFYESRLNLNWRQILKTITDDPQSFVDNGGWEFLNLEATDSESDNSEESDQGYEPSASEPESVSEEEDSDSASLVESEEEDDDVSEADSEDEKGKTWEELEREASNADREKGAESDSEDERKRRKAKTAFGRPRPGPPPSSLKRSKLR
ncbi:unnamed protein product [Linum tenue]|uniref:FACT complex subunit n=1 Tax=Linum tenue TaxID=586396 RepID=A0AAV0P472_9ROSI|nr:unnamed protein product [Linum tenue]